MLGFTAAIAQVEEVAGDATLKAQLISGIWNGGVVLTPQVSQGVGGFGTFCTPAVIVPDPCTPLRSPPVGMVPSPYTLLKAMNDSQFTCS